MNTLTCTYRIDKQGRHRTASSASPSSPPSSTSTACTSTTLQPVQLPIPLDQPVPTQPIQHMLKLNWSHFKPEFAGKPEEGAEVHLLRTNEWVDTQAFLEGVKVQFFCLTLVGEARLWYESLIPINVDCLGLQNQFRQQYSKIGNTREQLFHAWQSFHFDENIETLDSMSHA